MLFTKSIVVYSMTADVVILGTYEPNCGSNREITGTIVCEELSHEFSGLSCFIVLFVCICFGIAF